MKITYIYHSGFLVETKDCYYIFDYYKKEIPKLNPEKPVFVFSSHSHGDHYEPRIFELLHQQNMKKIIAVLSKDISKKRHPQNEEVVVVRANEEYDLPFATHLETLLSTDCGVAFLLTCPEGTIYHAGDLNDWVWEGEPEQKNRQMTGMYRHEIDKLKGQKIDVAFLTLDPRQEDFYANGILYFLKKVSVEKVYPMHYWNRPRVIDRFLKEYPEYEGIIEQRKNNEDCD